MGLCSVAHVRPLSYLYLYFPIRTAGGGGGGAGEEQVGRSDASPDTEHMICEIFLTASPTETNPYTNGCHGNCNCTKNGEGLHGQHHTFSS